MHRGLSLLWYIEIDSVILTYETKKEYMISDIGYSLDSKRERDY